MNHPSPYEELDKLSNFVLTNQLVIQSEKEMRKDTPMQILKPVKKATDNVFYPEYTDKLFWCFYIILHGMEAYSNIGNKVFSIEKDEKIKYVEKFRLCKDKFKAAKIPLQTVEDELANNPWITTKTLHALCIYHNISIMLVWDRKFHNFFYGDKVHIIHKIKDRYCLDTESDLSSKINKYSEEYLYIENLDKPIKSISSYKIDELVVLAKKLNISENDTTGKKRTKKVLYEEIIKNI